MTPGGRETRRSRGRDIFTAVVIAVLTLLSWCLLRSFQAAFSTYSSSTVVSTHLRRVAQHRPDTLTDLVSGGRPSRSRAARFLSVLQPRSDAEVSSAEQLDGDAQSRSVDPARIWEYLLEEASSRNVGQPLTQRGAPGGPLSDLSSDGSTSQGSSDVQLALSSNSSKAAAEAGHGMAAQQHVQRLPDAFDWQTYLLYYPDLSEHNITTEAQAQQHYLEWGRQEHRVYCRLRVVMRYTACTGLINQHYSHIAAFTLAAAVNAELVLAPAVQRDSFAKVFSSFKEKNEVQWTPAPLESLLDVDHIIEAWATRGMAVHKTPALEPFPDLTEPQTAFPLYLQPELDVQHITRLEGVYLQNLELGELVERMRDAVVSHAWSLQRQAGDPDAHPPYIVLDLPCTFFMLRTRTAQRLVGDVARSLHFAPLLEGLAERIVTNMTRGGRLPFNAAHLRIEKDAKDWSMILGGDGVVWDRYVLAMQKAKFNASVGMYVASGLLTYGASQEMADIVAMLKQHQLCSDILYKELYLPAEELEALSLEQKALVDFLVLARGDAFVGFGPSTFSFYMREFRALHGIPRASSVLVDASIIGTDPLFYSAGVVV